MIDGRVRVCECVELECEAIGAGDGITRDVGALLKIVEHAKDLIARAIELRSEIDDGERSGCLREQLQDVETFVESGDGVGASAAIFHESDGPELTVSLSDERHAYTIIGAGLYLIALICQSG